MALVVRRIWTRLLSALKEVLMQEIWLSMSFLFGRGWKTFPMLLKKTRILIGRFEGSLRLAAEGADVLIFAADYPPCAS